MNKKKVQDFMLYGKESQKSNEEYVLLKAGKGKSKDGQVFINAITFSYIEGMIWDKYRGYGTREKTRILSSEWIRIIDGFDEGVEQLKLYKDGDNLKKALQFNLVHSKYPLDDLDGHLSELEKLIEEMNAWLKVQVQEEKHVSIMKEYL